MAMKKGSSLKPFALFGFIGGALVIVGLLGAFGTFDLDFFAIDSSRADPDSLGKAITIKTMSANWKEAGSGSFTAVSTGTLDVYETGADPSKADVDPIKQWSLNSGRIDQVNATPLRTETAYRLVYDGVGTYYDVDYGTIVFRNANYDTDQGIFTFSPDTVSGQSGDLDGALVKITTLDDICDETATGSKACLNEQEKTTHNGSATGVSDIGCEALCAGDATIFYNETTGDGTFNTFFTTSVSGADTFGRNLALCFTADQANPPEFNEVTALTISVDSGTDFLNTPSNGLDFWINEECFVAPEEWTKSGSSAVLKFVWTVDESVLDANDDFTIDYDDLGDDDAKDILLNRKGTKEVWTFGGSVT